MLKNLNDDEKRLLRTLLLTNFLMLAYTLIFIFMGIMGNLYIVGWIMFIIIYGFIIISIVNLVFKFIIFKVISICFKLINKTIINSKFSLFLKEFLRYIGFIADFLIIIRTVEVIFKNFFPLF